MTKHKQHKKVKIRPVDYKETMFKNGFFNPECPYGFNFLTGYVDVRPDKEIRRLSLSMSGKLNGSPVHNF